MIDDNIELRIRERAHRIWEEEGRPGNKATAHWELAKIAVALEDARGEMLKAVTFEKPEPIEAVLNQGEFPTLRDQGESKIPAFPNDSKARESLIQDLGLSRMPNVPAEMGLRSGLAHNPANLIKTLAISGALIGLVFVAANMLARRGTKVSNT
jgi:hypothetical protein